MRKTYPNVGSKDSIVGWGCGLDKGAGGLEDMEEPNLLHLGTRLHLKRKRV